MISIVIPTFNNLKYLQLCINSLKNSIYDHEIILHVNDGSDGTLDYAKTQRFINFLIQRKYRSLFSNK